MAIKYTSTIIPEYQKPDAIMVPHFSCQITPLLEEVAMRISLTCGVILLSSDKAFTQEFLETQKSPEHFSIVTATFDSPWIRDRSPVAIKTENGVRWCLPQVEKMDRPNDDRLFSLICAKEHQFSPIEFLAQGNIVAGDKGLILVTNDVLKQNDYSYDEMEQFKPIFGVRHWLIFSSFKKEQTGHADVLVRVLKSNLFAIAWNMSSKKDRITSKKLIKQIKKLKPNSICIKIPIRSVGKKFASLINWIQIGKRLIIPRYDITTKDDIAQTKETLEQHGFKIEFIYSPTLKYGGSIHCLTASIYV